MPEQLETEIATFNKLLPSLMKDQGKYALIIGENLVGLYGTYEDALNAGYEKVQLRPFLVKKITGAQSIANFSRDIGIPCLTSQS